LSDISALRLPRAANSDSDGFANKPEDSMWTDITREQHARKDLSLPSDLKDAEWATLEPLLPSSSRVGRPRKWPMRRIFEALLYLLRGGLPWRMLPPGFPPVSTVQRYFYAWRDSGLFETMNHYLLMAVREAIGREASPSAGVIDSQSVKTTESGGPRGYDAGKKVKGRKRHILTDTQGFLTTAVVHTADIQDRDGAPDVIKKARYSFPWMRHLFADGGYAGDKLKNALSGCGEWTVEIIKRSDTAQGFVLLPRRWVVERSFAWFGRNRRLAKDFEATLESSTAWLYMASIQLITRRIAAL
jgi:putative transposase